MVADYPVPLRSVRALLDIGCAGFGIAVPHVVGLWNVASPAGDQGVAYQGLSYGANAPVVLCMIDGVSSRIFRSGPFPVLRHDSDLTTTGTAGFFPPYDPDSGAFTFHTGNFTLLVSVTMRRNASAGSDTYVCAHERLGGGRGCFGLFANGWSSGADQRFWCQVQTGGVVRSLVDASTWAAGVHEVLVVVREDDDLRLYRGGSLVASRTGLGFGPADVYTDVDGTVLEVLLLGGSYDSGAGNAQADFDLVASWDEALTGAQIAAVTADRWALWGPIFDGLYPGWPGVGPR